MRLQYGKELWKEIERTILDRSEKSEGKMVRKSLQCLSWEML